MNMVQSDGRVLMPAIWIDDDNVALHVGAPYEPGPVLIANSNGISECPGILSFGRSHDHAFVALAKEAAIEIRRGWNGEVAATLPWPGAFENIPAPQQKIRAPKPLTITQLMVFPDGERVLLTSSSGVFILTRDRTVQLLPRPEEYVDWIEDGEDAAKVDLSMEHAALSPAGDPLPAAIQVPRPNRPPAWHRDDLYAVEIFPYEAPGRLKPPTSSDSIARPVPQESADRIRQPAERPGGRD